MSGLLTILFSILLWIVRIIPWPEVSYNWAPVFQFIDYMATFNEYIPVVEMMKPVVLYWQLAVLLYIARTLLIRRLIGG